METKNVSYFPFEWNVSLFPNKIKKVQEYIKGTVRHVLKEHISKTIIKQKWPFYLALLSVFLQL